MRSGLEAITIQVKYRVIIFFIYYLVLYASVYTGLITSLYPYWHKRKELTPSNTTGEIHPRNPAPTSPYHIPRGSVGII